MPLPIQMSIWNLPKTIKETFNKANELKEIALEKRSLQAVLMFCCVFLVSINLCLHRELKKPDTSMSWKRNLKNRSIVAKKPKKT